MSRRITFVLVMMFVICASIFIPAASAVDANYDSLHALCERHPHVDTGGILGLLTQNYKVYYSAKYIGHGMDVWTFIADKVPEIRLDIVIYENMDSDIYRKCALFINDADYILKYGCDIFNQDTYQESLQRHERAIATLRDLKRSVGDYSMPSTTNNNFNVQLPKLR